MLLSLEIEKFTLRRRNRGFGFSGDWSQERLGTPLRIFPMRWSGSLHTKTPLPMSYDSNWIWTLQILSDIALSDIKKKKGGKKPIISLLLLYFKISYLADIGFPSVFHFCFKILQLVFSTTNYSPSHLIYLSIYVFSGLFFPNLITANYGHLFYFRLKTF